MNALFPEHREYLTSHAIANEVIDAAGVYSLGREIVFPWRDGEAMTEQRRPWPGKPGEYYWEKDEPLHFWVHRDPGPGATILLVEGTKQSLAAHTWAPPEYAVYGMVGCEGAARIKLGRFKGRKLVIINDADAASNANVYNAGLILLKRLDFYTKDVRFTHLPARGTTGLDDVLAKEFEPDERAEFISHLIAGAGGKPAEKIPPARGSGKKEDDGPPGVGDRVPVMVNEDRRDVVNLITGTLVEKLSGSALFNFGGLISGVSGHETIILNRDRFHGVLIDHVACFSRTEGRGPVQYAHTWPDSQSTGAVLSQAWKFAPLERITRTPFLRPDGTVCQTPGYDAATATYLASQGLDDLDVPNSPDQALISKCVEYLMGEWLGDFPFETTADRANALALVLTPFIRGSVPLMPLGILNGLHMGVGKNLMADVMSLMSSGDVAEPLAMPSTDDEVRKQITAVFQSGSDAFVFDEAHTLESKQLARALTSRTYTDRILGESRQGKFPNKVTWMALGNQVQVNGDMARRVFHVKLKPGSATPYDREGDTYRHPDLMAWTQANRHTLVRAALTVVRGWYAAGQPQHSRGWTMGSFEQWDRMLSGILGHAGVTGFLANERQHRSESDFSTSYWRNHLAWLQTQFGDRAFTTGEVRQLASQDRGGYEAPPDMMDILDDGYARRLGQAYARKRDVPMEGDIMLICTGTGHNNTKRWQVVRTNTVLGHTPS